MTAAEGPAPPGRRWLLACYPRSWRQRYGQEFAELLIAEQAERGRSWRHDADIAAAGLRARLASAGLGGHPLDPAAAARAGLATIAVSLSAAAIAGAAVWSRLAIGLQWSSPGTPGLVEAMDLISAALALIAVSTLLAAAPVVRAGVLAIARGQARALRRPVGLIAAGAGVLIIGGRHFQNGWPGTGGHLLIQHGMVPGGLAAFGWAATMWVTSYWAHPGALAAFPPGQVAWMAVSPAATGCLVAGAGADQVPLLRAGLIGQASLAVLALAAIAGACATRQSWAASRALAGTSAR
ncbi:MAG: hypothetical protein ACR2FU_16920 [Streptosporangiaceae bacterium]